MFPLYHFLRRRAAQVLVNLKYYSQASYCITVDFDTVGDEAKGIAADNCVTVRDRDTMEQVRMPISELKSYIESKIEF